MAFESFLLTVLNSSCAFPWSPAARLCACPSTATGMSLGGPGTAAGHAGAQPRAAGPAERPVSVRRVSVRPELSGLALLRCRTAQGHLVCVLCFPTRLPAGREPRQTGQHGAWGPVGRRVQLPLWGQAEDAGAEGQEAASAVPGALPGGDPELHRPGSAAPERWVPRGPRLSSCCSLSRTLPLSLHTLGSCPCSGALDTQPQATASCPSCGRRARDWGASFLGPGDSPRAAFASHRGKRLRPGDSVQCAPPHLCGPQL